MVIGVGGQESNCGRVVTMGKGMHVLGQKEYGKSLCLSLNFIVNLKCLSLKKS